MLTAPSPSTDSTRASRPDDNDAGCDHDSESGSETESNAPVTHGQVNGSRTMVTDPASLLNHLLSTQLTINIDNLQTLLRHMLKEQSTVKRELSETAVMADRLSLIERRLRALNLTPDQAAEMLQQVAICRKHNPHVAQTLTQMEERMSKDAARLNSRMAVVEERTTNMEAAITNQANLIQQQKQQDYQAHNRRASSSVSHSKRSSQDLTSTLLAHSLGANLSRPVDDNHGGSSKRSSLGGLDLGLSAQLSSLLQSQSEQLTQMAERMEGLERDALTAQRSSEESTMRIGMIANENKRLTEKIARMEDEIDKLRQTQTSVHHQEDIYPSQQSSRRSSVQMSDGMSRPHSSAKPPLPPAHSPTQSMSPAPSVINITTSHLSESDLLALQSRLELFICSRESTLRDEMEASITETISARLESKTKDQIATSKEVEEAKMEYERMKKESELHRTRVQQMMDQVNDALTQLRTERQQQKDALVAEDGSSFSPVNTQHSNDKDAVDISIAVPSPNSSITRDSSTSSSQHDLDRLRAMVELSLRRTVQQNQTVTTLDESIAKMRAQLTHYATHEQTETIKTAQSTAIERIQRMENQLETLNSLALSTRNQLQSQLDFASCIEDHPLVKSMHLKLVETEMKCSELGDKVTVLAHLLSKAKAKDQPDVESAGAAIGPAHDTSRRRHTFNRRSLVSTLAAAMDDHAAAVAAAAADTNKEEQDDLQVSTRRATDDIEPRRGRQQKLDEDAMSLNMILRTDSRALTTDGTTTPTTSRNREGMATPSDHDAHPNTVALPPTSVASLQSNLLSLRELESKLGELQSLESRLSILEELDLSDRIDAVDRRLGTEITFLKATMQTKADQPIVTTLMDKMENERDEELEALRKEVATLREAMATSATVDTRHTRSPSRLQAPSTAMDRVHRDRRARNSHLLSLLERKVDASTFKQCEGKLHELESAFKEGQRKYDERIQKLKKQGGFVTDSNEERDNIAPAAPSAFDMTPTVDNGNNAKRAAQPNPHHRKALTATSATASHLAQLDHNTIEGLNTRFENLEKQIAHLHALITNKQDNKQQAGLHRHESGIGSNGMVDAAGQAQTTENANRSYSTTAITSSDLSPILSRLDSVSVELTHLQGLVLYHARQLTNHKEWIAKHTRDITAIKNSMGINVEMEMKESYLTGGVGRLPMIHANGSRTAREGGTRPRPYTSAADSPPIVQVIRNLEGEVVSIRQSLQQKVDFMDLGVSNPHDPLKFVKPLSSDAPSPQPSLDHLRRLLVYLAPKLEASPTDSVSNSQGDGSVMDDGRRRQHPAEHQYAMLTSRAHYSPNMQHQHDHDALKCMACDRPLDGSISDAPRAPRHSTFTPTLGSIAPAGGLIGSNTRRLITQSNVNAPHRSTSNESNNVPTVTSSIVPRPPVSRDVSSRDGGPPSRVSIAHSIRTSRTHDM